MLVKSIEILSQRSSYGLRLGSNYSSLERLLSTQFARLLTVGLYLTVACLPPRAANLLYSACDFLTNDGTLILKTQTQRMPKLRPVDSLLFDPENFRYANGPLGQDDILRLLDRDYQLEVIGESLAENGFFSGEPLVAIAKEDEFIVVEGNRRLAALKLLLKPNLRRLSRREQYWDNLSRRMKYDISQVPVIDYDNREQVVAFLGYRHFAGIVEWEPLQKARFIADLVEKKGSFAAVSSDTGASRPTARDNYVAYRALQQAKTEFDIDTSELEEDFSVFYRALSNPAISKYVGLKKGASIRELRRPIPVSKRARLAEIVSYVHGTKNEPPVMRESRLLTKLGEILENKRATEVLKKYRDFDKAYALSGGEKKRLVDNLQEASTSLDAALMDIHRHRRDTDVQEMVRRIADSVRQIVKHFPSIQKSASS